jgi:XTP/dITP diphosphohydrolase
VVANWEELKASEKPERTGPFDGVVASQPALPYAEKLLGRAAKAGAPAPERDALADRIADHLGEALAADAPEDRSAAVGRLLLDVVALARADGVDPELALRGAAAAHRANVEARLDGPGSAGSE